MFTITEGQGPAPATIPRMLSRPSLLPTSSSPGKGSRSPTSIPSSPTSIRSASSAIFERDIEPITATSTHLNVHQHHPHPHVHYPNPHRTPRTHQTEQCVPSVLAEAATALAHSDDTETANISILAPLVSSSNVGVAMALAMSRSPSPPGFASPSSVPSPLGGTTPLPGDCPVVAPSSSSPPSSYPSSPHLKPADQIHPTRGLSLLSDTSPHIDPSSLPPPPPQPHTSPSKRLSFVSYTDILTSTPISAIPLNAYTSGAVSGSISASSAGGTGSVAGTTSRPRSIYSTTTAGRNSLFISDYLEQIQNAHAPQEPYSLLDSYTPETLPSALPSVPPQSQSSAQHAYYVHPSHVSSLVGACSPPAQPASSTQTHLVSHTPSRSRSQSPPPPDSSRNERPIHASMDDTNSLHISTHATEWQREGLGRGMEEVLEHA